MGGSFAPVWVAAFTWNGWQASAEYADKPMGKGIRKPYREKPDARFDEGTKGR